MKKCHLCNVPYTAFHGFSYSHLKRFYNAQPSWYQNLILLTYAVGCLVIGLSPFWFVLQLPLFYAMMQPQEEQELPQPRKGED